MATLLGVAGMDWFPLYKVLKLTLLRSLFRLCSKFGFVPYKPQPLQPLPLTYELAPPQGCSFHLYLFCFVWATFETPWILPEFDSQERK